MSTKIDVDKLDFAFQPIVNSYTGKIFAVEALLRNTKNIGFDSIKDFFDYLFETKELYKIDIKLRKKAIKKFKELNIKNIKLFYNVDNRFFSMPDFVIGKTSEILDKYGINHDNFCFELTEHHAYGDELELHKIINTYKKNNYNIAIDDFGTGISGLHLLYISDTNFIKIDKFFINNIDSDQKKRLFCASIVEMAHIMGIKVIAEGIERIEEYFTCKEIKVDYVQGFLVAKPTLHPQLIKKSYAQGKLFQKDRRLINSNNIDKSYIEKIDPISDNSNLHDLFMYFKEHTKNTFVPVIDSNKKILGAIYEVDIKEISYSQYGLALAKNQSFKAKLRQFVKPVPEIDIAWGIDKALEIFNMRNDATGIFVSKDSRYYGFINLNNLLSLSYKRNLEIAQNQNPLTKLPGNRQIDIFIHNIFEKEVSAQIVYFDFNDFKPFNDTYGFRQGDRAILMFSEILQKNVPSEQFIAHVGGDDFFIGFIDMSYENVYKLVKDIQEEFRINASSLYNEIDMENNFTIAKDRYGIERKFKLLSVCAAIIEKSPKCLVDDFNSNLGRIKKLSKSSDLPLGICIIM